jgi:CO/xanthine dehydrogenase Mo-binding subunit
VSSHDAGPCGASALLPPTGAASAALTRRRFLQSGGAAAVSVPAIAAAADPALPAAPSSAAAPAEAPLAVAPRLPEGGRAGVDPPAGRVLSLLQDDVVSYDNQPIAVVVADTIERAAQGARLVRASYERTGSAAVLDFDTAKAHAHAPAKANREPTAPGSRRPTPRPSSTTTCSSRTPRLPPGTATG